MASGLDPRRRPPPRHIRGGRIDRYEPNQGHGHQQPFRFGNSHQESHGRDAFTFRSGASNTRLRFSQERDLPSDRGTDLYRPGPPRKMPRRERAPRQGNNQTNDARVNRSNGRPRAQDRRRGGGMRGRRGIHERPLLQGHRSPTPEQLSGMSTTEARFKAIEDLSDSDEAGMELDSELDGEDSNDDDSDKRSRKKVATGETAKSGDSVPKWSNPDPYTALPPIDTVKGKTKDFVSLIRKARTSDKKQESFVDGDDFISFGLDDAEDDDSDEDDEKSRPGQDEKATQPIALNERYPEKSQKQKHSLPQKPTASLPQRPVQFDIRKAGLEVDPHGPPPVPSRNVFDAMSSAVDSVVDTVSNAAESKITSWPPPPSAPLSMRENRIGQNSRKRGREEDSDESYKGRPGKAKPFLPRGAQVAGDWRPARRTNSTPWCTVDHSKCEDLSLRLHKEVCDFYDYVCPRDFERTARQDLVRRVQKFLADRMRGFEVHSFGSFPVNLYLPDGDMDLVVLSRNFLDGGFPVFLNRKKELFKFSSQLQNYAIPKAGSVAVIAKAKVPLIKYVDQATGLKVDISFENPTGPAAIKTYTRWKAQYSALPVLVTLIKQLLHMRELDDVSVGGLGGFAVTCLVVSLLQHMPQLQSNEKDPAKNLGELLLIFLDYYGNKFNTTETAIQVDPPAQLSKSELPASLKVAKQPWLLVVVDPNNPENNITKGTYNIKLVQETFSEAFSMLQQRLDEIRSGNNKAPDGGLLGPLFAGNYALFENQRSRLKLYQSKS